MQQAYDSFLEVGGPAQDHGTAAQVLSIMALKGGHKIYKPAACSERRIQL